MTTPPTPPATSAALVAAQLQMDATDAAILERLGPATDAANAWVAAHATTRGPLRTFGATMLAARWYRRRNSPEGVATMGQETPVYVQRNDPDLAQLLGIGAYAPPVVG